MGGGSNSTPPSDTPPGGGVYPSFNIQQLMAGVGKGLQTAGSDLSHVSIPSGAMAAPQIASGNLGAYQGTGGYQIQAPPSLLQLLQQGYGGML